MKTAEEWIKLMGVEVDTGHLPPQTQLTMSGIIKRIQLDSWKQGMNDASVVVRNKKDYEELLRLRDTKTTI